MGRVTTCCNRVVRSIDNPFRSKPLPSAGRSFELSLAALVRLRWSDARRAPGRAGPANRVPHEWQCSVAACLAVPRKVAQVARRNAVVPAPTRHQPAPTRARKHPKTHASPQNKRQMPRQFRADRLMSSWSQLKAHKPIGQTSAKRSAWGAVDNPPQRSGCAYSKRSHSGAQALSNGRGYCSADSKIARAPTSDICISAQVHSVHGCAVRCTSFCIFCATLAMQARMGV